MPKKIQTVYFMVEQGQGYSLSDSWTKGEKPGINGGPHEHIKSCQMSVGSKSILNRKLHRIGPHQNVDHEAFGPVKLWLTPGIHDIRAIIVLVLEPKP